MRSRFIVGSAALLAALGVGCATILGISDRSEAPQDAGPEAGSNSADVGVIDAGVDGPVEWCNRPENKHDFCDDFDHPDAGSQWTSGSSPDASAQAFVPSTDSPPQALDLQTFPEPLGAQAVTGLYYPFSQALGHIHFEVDLRIVSLDLQSEGGLSSQLGFMLLEQTGFCLGLVMTPAGIGTVMRYQSTNCTDVNDLPVDAGTVVDDGGLTSFAIVAAVPNVGQWYHVSLDLKLNADGSGAVGFDINYPGHLQPPQIPAGYLTDASPAIAVATSVVGPSGNVELQFDNVTADFLKN
jgi:hypothetical protein